MNLWKKNISYFLSVLLLLGFEIHYLMSLTSTEDSHWTSQIDYTKIFLYAIIPLTIIIYILFMRHHVPKAKKDKVGILFCVCDANEKNYNIIKKKFIKPFDKIVNKYSDKYDVVTLDDYHSSLYRSKFKNCFKQDRNEIANYISKRNCQIAIVIYCEDGGDDEKILCNLDLNLFVVHPELPKPIHYFLEKDISNALSAIKKINIFRESETENFHQYTQIFNYLFKFIFGTVQLHCGFINDALNIFNELEMDALNEDSNINATITNQSLWNRIGFCNMLIASTKFSEYCETHDKRCLLTIRKHIDNKHCKNNFYQHILVLRGICYYAIERNITAALQCMNEADKKNPVIKFNKIFLKLCKECSSTNLLQAYKIYKGLNKLSESSFRDLESFIYNEYMEDETQYQLVFLLMLIYDYKNDEILAKKALERFCSNQLFQSLKLNETLQNVINKYKLKYQHVIVDENENYSL